MARWGPGKWTLVQRIQVTAWALPMAAYVYCVPVCFNTLRGKEVADFNAIIVSQSISLGIAVLVGSPALDFIVAAHARSLGRAATFRPIKIRLYIQERKLLKVLDELIKIIDENIKLMDRHQSLIDEIRSDTDLYSKFSLAEVSNHNQEYEGTEQARIRAKRHLQDAVEKRSQILNNRKKKLIDRREELDRFEIFIRTSLIPGIESARLAPVDARTADSKTTMNEVREPEDPAETSALGWPGTKDGPGNATV